MEKNDHFKYILRYAIQPGFCEEERFDNLVHFCKDASIDEVMFFINCEELNQGHLTNEKTIIWIDMISKFKKRLDEYGIVTSINPWITLLHTDRGRYLKKGQKFHLMTDPYGNRASAVVCPLCEEWRKYISGIYSLYASIKPKILWVEDDFRLHNHAPLIWGGCFCDLHMAEYSKRIGKEISREEFYSGIIKQGKPHLFRKVWLDVSREQMVDVAGIIGEAVHKVSPGTRVGLMSSPPVDHCVEGRDWEGILKNLSGNLPMVIRPHLPAYVEITSQNYLAVFNSVSRLTRAVIPEKIEIYPELENFPNTRFSKSTSFTGFQLETTSVIDATGITLNIFDMMGNGVLMEEGYQHVLASSKGYMKSISRLGLKASNQQGIRVLFNPRSSYTLHTEKGFSMDELCPSETFWAELLSSYGITNTFCLDSRQTGRIMAVSGQYFRNLCESEIRDLFDNNFILLEGQAAATLYDMGYGLLAGIEEIKWYEQNSGCQSYEEVYMDDTYSGIIKARMSCQNTAGRYLYIKYAKEPVLMTVVKSPEGTIVGPGMAVYDRKVCLFPFGFFDNGYQAHLNSTKQQILQKVIQNAHLGGHTTFVIGNPYIAIYEYICRNHKALIIYNASGDDLLEIKVHLPGRQGDEFMEMSRQQFHPMHICTLSEGENITLLSSLKRLELKVFLYK